MNHRNRGRKFGRNHGSRKALLLNLAQSLVQHEQIMTTLPKAKDLRPYIEKLITMAGGGTLHSQRLLLSRLRNKDIVKKLMTDIGPRFKDRTGGYTRILKAGFRSGDQAPMAVIQFVDRSPAPVAEAA